MDAPFASVGLRIKALRGDLSLREFAARLGVDHKSVSGWEAGKRLPDGSSLLALMEQFSADVNFILTGQRQEALPAVDPSEQLLLENYRRCKLEAKQTLLQSSVLFAAGLPPAAPATAAKKAAPASINMRMSSTHDGSVQVGYAGGKVTVKKTKS
ncbi:helix-turn-helix domain-containing protein [Comamonas aquatica]|uniref:helix-turn-helix domain-containing protein n=1 Tax=Comamonas aquatica TaxID=225991 RepID=UPI00244CB5B6|nr:helix-turn-helix transcriptional regulator [Comamonas aquatica]MDH1766273.1 helix-turn-helix domain-containing protein [Comamonas aquatica]